MVLGKTPGMDYDDFARAGRVIRDFRRARPVLEHDEPLPVQRRPEDEALVRVVVEALSGRGTLRNPEPEIETLAGGSAWNKTVRRSDVHQSKNAAPGARSVMPDLPPESLQPFAAISARLPQGPESAPVMEDDVTSECGAGGQLRQ